MHLNIFRRKSGGRRAQHGSRDVVTAHESQAYDVKGLPVDVLEHVFHYLDKRDVVALSCTCKLLRDVASSPGSTVWSNLTRRAFLFEELPKDLEFLSSKDTPLIRKQFWQLTRQRPAFLSDAPRTSEILEHTGSRFSKVLHVDGRRDFNFTTVFRDVPPGQYNVVWRLMLQPGYVRGYCNFRAVFSRPTDHNAAAANKPLRKPKSNPATHMAATIKHMLLGATTKPDPKATAGARTAERGGWGFFRRCGRQPGSPVTMAPFEYPEEDGPFPDPSGVQLRRQRAGTDLAAQPGRGSRTWRLRRRLRWRPSCMSTTAASAGRSDDNSRSSIRSCCSSSSVKSVKSGGGTSSDSNGGIPQHAAPAPDAFGPEPLLGGAPQRSRSVSSAPPAHPHRQDQQAGQQQPTQQQQQQQQPQLQVAFAVRSEFPEIEPVLPLQLPPPSPAPMAVMNAYALLQQALEVPDVQAPPPQQPLLQRPSAVQRAASAPAAGPQAQLQRAMGQLATVSAKRGAALAAAGGPRYVPRWLSPLWGGYACDWRQLDPAGPLGQGAWRSLQLGTLTVRRAADAHLHGVMVQLRPVNPEQQELALPSGEMRWRGALVDYVELVPVRSGKLLGGLLPGFLRRGSVQRGSPVVPPSSDIVEVPRL